jgi:hypothetical protein
MKSIFFVIIVDCLLFSIASNVSRIIVRKITYSAAKLTVFGYFGSSPQKLTPLPPEKVCIHRLAYSPPNQEVQSA